MGHCTSFGDLTRALPVVVGLVPGAAPRGACRPPWVLGSSVDALQGACGPGPGEVLLCGSVPFLVPPAR